MMGNDGVLWGVMGFHGVVWGIFGMWDDGESWGFVELYGELWGFMGNYGELWGNIRMRVQHKSRRHAFTIPHNST